MLVGMVGVEREFSGLFLNGTDGFWRLKDVFFHVFFFAYFWHETTNRGRYFWTLVAPKLERNSMHQHTNDTYLGIELVEISARLHVSVFLF